MRRVSSRAALIAVMSALACQSDATESVEAGGGVVVSATDSAGIRVVEIRGPVEALPPWRLAETPTAEINGNSPPHIGSVGAAAIARDGAVLVYDRQRNELYVFDPAGGEPRLLAGPGDGPGELGAIEQLVVTETGEIHAFDRRHNRVSVFGQDGAFRDVVAVSPFFGPAAASIRHAWLTGSDRVIRYGVVVDPDAASGGASRTVRDRVIQIGAADGADPGTAVRFAGEFVVGGTMGQIGSPFSNRPILALRAGRVVHGAGSTYELTVSDLDLEPFRVIRWMDWPRVFTSSVLERAREPMSASLSDLRAVNPSAADQLLDDVLGDEALPDVLPALGSALLDESGRLWVGRFELTHDLRVSTTEGYEPWNQVDAWHVLEPDGRPVARVVLPPRTRLLGVGNDLVVVVTRDEFDVEHVRVFEIPDARR